MPPKIKISKEEIIHTALALVRQQGPQAINARTIASILNCSTQPIFSNFASMDELRLAVTEDAYQLYWSYLDREIESGKYPEYKASGMGYIRFAKEEKELFKLLYMCDRSSAPIPDDNDQILKMTSIVHHCTGLDIPTAQLFHLEMWAYVHGIATMFATGYLDLDWELVNKMLSDAYLGLRKQYGMEE